MGGEGWEVYTVLTDADTVGASPQRPAAESGQAVCCGGQAAEEQKAAAAGASCC
jgi:hypothetical protein